MAKTKILIVDDEMIATMSLVMIFRKLGYDVYTPLSSGEQAIITVEQSPPDVVLMDIGLRGGMDGIEAAKQIHSRFGIPIAFITGYVDQEIMEQANLVEPIGYFIKPFDIQQLRNAIDTAVQKQKSNGAEQKNE